MRRAERTLRQGEPALPADPPGQTEVGYVRLTFRTVEQDIARLQVAVQNAAVVGMMHCARDCGD
jgi:hypothetical protein